jgi:hypothetical protein
MGSLLFPFCMGHSIKYYRYRFFEMRLIFSVVTFILCWVIIGPATLCGFAAMLIMVPANWVLAKWITHVNASVMQAKDKRSKVCCGDFLYDNSW